MFNYVYHNSNIIAMYKVHCLIPLNLGSIPFILAVSNNQDQNMFSPSSLNPQL